jgi:hypothetical protein
VIAALTQNKIEADAPFMTLDSVDAVGGYTGEIAVLASAFGPILTGILGAWLQSTRIRQAASSSAHFAAMASKASW